MLLLLLLPLLLLLLLAVAAVCQLDSSCYFVMDQCCAVHTPASLVSVQCMDLAAAVWDCT
jgi:hypothetical protein